MKIDFNNMRVQLLLSLLELWRCKDKSEPMDLEPITMLVFNIASIYIEGDEDVKDLSDHPVSELIRELRDKYE